MSETPADEKPTPDEPAAGARPAASPPPAEPRKRSSAAARARRIGGRPVSGPPARPRPEQRDATDATDAVAGAAPAVDLAKPATAPDTGSAPASKERSGTDHGAPAGSPAAASAAVPAWLNWAPAGVLAAGAVVMAVLMLIFSHGVWWGPSPDTRPSAAKVNQVREQILAAAKSCVAATNDYSYTDLDGYEKRALACTTGQLTGKLRKTIETIVKQTAPGLKAKQTTQISRGGLESVSPDGKQWTILLFGQLSVVNSNYPKGRTDPFGAQALMEKVHGKWLMADLIPVSSPVQG